MLDINLGEKMADLPFAGMFQIIMYMIWASKQHWRGETTHILA
jgi:hypothetical protein